MKQLTRPIALAVVTLASSAHAETLSDTRKAELIRLVRQDCGSCHGMTLKGGLGKPLVPQALEALDLSQLVSIILDGMPGTPMPPWKELINRDEASWIAERLKEGFPP